MKFTRTLLLVFVIALILPFVSNIKNSEAKTGIRRFELYGGIMFMSGYKIAKRYQKDYYAYCKKKLNIIEKSKFEFGDMPDHINSSNRTDRQVYLGNHYLIEKCLQGVQTYKEIYKK